MFLDREVAWPACNRRPSVLMVKDSSKQRCEQAPYVGVTRSPKLSHNFTFTTLITYLDFVLHVGTGSSYPGRPLNTTFAFLFFGFFVRDARLAKSARTRISETAIPRGIAFPFQELDITSIFQYINCGRLHICRERYRCDRTNTRRSHFSSPVLPDLETPFPVYR